MKWPIFFALLTAFFWGMYGPVLGWARAAEGNNPFKPYLLIGVAYLIWAIIGGALGMLYTKVPFEFSGDGLKWGFSAGSLGAFGALTLTLAMFAFPPGKAQPQVVMPIVFGGAVTVTAVMQLIASMKAPNAHAPSPWLWVGIAGMAVCIVIVAYNTPHVAPPKKATPAPAPAEATTETPAASAPNVGEGTKE